MLETAGRLQCLHATLGPRAQVWPWGCTGGGLWSQSAPTPLGTRHSSGQNLCCIGFPHIYPDITWAGALPTAAQCELTVQKSLLENEVSHGRKKARMPRRRVL